MGIAGRGEAAIQDRTLPLVMLFISAGIYGILFSLNKIAAEAGVPALGYVFWYCLIGGVVLLAASFFRGLPPSWRWRHVRAYTAIGALGIGIPMVFLTRIAPELPAGLMTMVLCLSPPVTYVLGLLARLERFHWIAVLGLLVGFSGVMLIVAPAAALPSPEMARWFLLSLLAPLMFATANICAALLRPPAETSTAMGSGILLGSALVLLGASLFMHDLGSLVRGYLGPGGWTVPAAAAVMAIFIIMFLEIVRMAGPVFFAQFNYLAVLAGIAWSYMLFGERLSGWAWAAFALMCAGVMLTTMRGGLVRALRPRRKT